MISAVDLREFKKDRRWGFICFFVSNSEAFFSCDEFNLANVTNLSTLHWGSILKVTFKILSFLAIYAIDVFGTLHNRFATHPKHFLRKKKIFEKLIKKLQKKKIFFFSHFRPPKTLWIFFFSAFLLVFGKNREKTKIAKKQKSTAFWGVKNGKKFYFFFF